MQDKNKRQEEARSYYDNALKAQQRLAKADEMAYVEMLAHGYKDPRLATTIHGSVDDFDKCKEYDQKLAYFRHVALKKLESQVTVNVPRSSHYTDKY